MLGENRRSLVMEKTLKEILERITPPDEEHKKELSFARKLTDYLGRFKVKPIVVGSLAKGTDLHGDKDVDVFIMFPEDTRREKLEKDGLRIGKQVFKKFGGKHEIDYAEHPYVKGRINGFDVEVVPCYMGDEIKSSVDRTPFHTRYVKRKISGNPSLSGEIRLLKQFMKGVGVYGAEAKVQGFSGYLTEVLAINYGSFKKVLEAASSWRFGETLDPENLWENKESLKYFFTNAALIVVDPVDKDRNVSAAVSKQSLAEFIVAAKEFLKKPSKNFFFPKEEKTATKNKLKERIRKRKTKLAAFVFRHKKINENSLYSQIRKTEEALKKSFTVNDFRVFKTGFWTNEEDTSVILLEFEVWQLPPVKHHAGPPIDADTVNQEKFVETHMKHKPYIKDGRWVVDTERKIREITELSPIILKEKHGFGKDLRSAKTKTLYDERILEISDKKYLKFMDKLV
jgi:tRNA nucleotidyltransferase (CCA-adding enzyme)